MLSPIEIFKQMVDTDAQIVNNFTQSSFATYKQQLTQLGFTSRTNNSFISESTTPLIAYTPILPISSSSYTKIDEWQKQQDQYTQQLNNQKPQMYIPVYPIRRQFDLRSRLEQHNAQLSSVNASLDNRLLRTPLQIPNHMDSQILSEFSDQYIIKQKIPEDDIKKKSNLKTNTNKTVEKKSVKIEEKRKSQSEQKKIVIEKEKSPKKSDKPPKPPKKEGEKTLKKEKSNTSLSKSPKKDVKSADNTLTVDNFLQKAKKKK